MLARRIIPCLDIKEGRVVKGIRFGSLRVVGNPVELAMKYYMQGADELCLLDISASAENRSTMIEVVKNVAKKIFIPFTVGGGVKKVEDINVLLRSGADKVSICTAAVKNPELIREASARYGSQCIVVSLDAKRVSLVAPKENEELDLSAPYMKNDSSRWELYIYGGNAPTGIGAVEFAKICELLGAGELLINSLDRDGCLAGYDLELIKAVSEAVSIPVIASSGAGNMEDICNVLTMGKADAALAASLFHYGRLTVGDIKLYLKNRGVDVRL